MPCLAAKALARPRSRAATATTSTSSTCRAGRISAAGAIRAAPSTPMRMGGIAAGYSQWEVDLGLPLPGQPDRAQDDGRPRAATTRHRPWRLPVRATPPGRGGGGPGRPPALGESPPGRGQTGQDPGARGVLDPDGVALQALARPFARHPGAHRHVVDRPRQEGRKPDRGGGSSSGRTWGCRLIHPSWAAARWSMTPTTAEVSSSRNSMSCVPRRVTVTRSRPLASARAAQRRPVEAVDGGELLDGEAP